MFQKARSTKREININLKGKKDSKGKNVHEKGCSGVFHVRGQLSYSL